MHVYIHIHAHTHRDIPTDQHTYSDYCAKGTTDPQLCTEISLSPRVGSVNQSCRARNSQAVIHSLIHAQAHAHTGSTHTAHTCKQIEKDASLCMLTPTFYAKVECDMLDDPVCWTTVLIPAVFLNFLNLYDDFMTAS